MKKNVLTVGSYPTGYLQFVLKEGIDTDNFKDKKGFRVDASNLKAILFSSRALNDDDIDELMK